MAVHDELSGFMDATPAIPFRPEVAKALALRATNPKQAMKVGRDDALFLQQLRFQLGRVGGKDHDGHHWVYKSRDEWASELAMGEGEFRACRERLLKDGFVVAISNPENSFYKDLWYRIDVAKLAAYLSSVCGPEPDDDVKAPSETDDHSIGDPSPMERPTVTNRPATRRQSNTEKTIQREPSEIEDHKHNCETSQMDSGDRTIDCGSDLDLARDVQARYADLLIEHDLSDERWQDKNAKRKDWTQFFLSVVFEHPTVITDLDRLFGLAVAEAVQARDEDENPTPIKGLMGPYSPASFRQWLSENPQAQRPQVELIRPQKARKGRTISDLQALAA